MSDDPFKTNTMFTRVRRPDGSYLRTFTQFTALGTSIRQAVELPIPLRPGDYRIEAEDGTVLGVGNLKDDKCIELSRPIKTNELFYVCKK